MIESLKQWAFALVLTATAGNVATAVSNSPNIKKYIKFACGLAALAVMIAPIKGLFQEFPNLFNYSQTSGEAYNPEPNVELNQIIIKKSAEILEQRISDTVYQKTGIKPENIYIYSNINNKNTEADIQVEIEKVIVEMPGEADISQIQAYLKEILDCEIIIE